MDTGKDKRMPFLAHLEELRRRLIVCIVIIGIGFIISYCFKEKLFGILIRPLVSVMEPGGKMIFTGLTEAFFCYLKTALITGILFAMPVIIYESWLFIVPGLYDKERQFLLPLVSLSLLFFVSGVLFCYFIIFPFSFKYLIGFATESIRALPSMNEYLSLTSILLLAFGFVFELPLVMTFVVRTRLVTHTFFKKTENMLFSKYLSQRRF